MIAAQARTRHWLLIAGLRRSRHGDLLSTAGMRQAPGVRRVPASAARSTWTTLWPDDSAHVLDSREPPARQTQLRVGVALDGAQGRREFRLQMALLVIDEGPVL